MHNVFAFLTYVTDLQPLMTVIQVVPSIEAGMVGVATHVGRRSYQEDRYRVAQLRPDLLYLAVFDGHGGSLCAEYCEEHFERHILHHLDREEDMLVVLDKSFHDVNRSFERWYTSKKKHLGRASSSGSTATVGLLQVILRRENMYSLFFGQDNYTLHLGHCGDSRAILCRCS